MPGFENYRAEARGLEHEIVRHGFAIGIDWDDAIAVRALAREALAYHFVELPPGQTMPIEARSKVEVFGLIHLMLKVMQESAAENMETHGGPTWKAMARALWAEAESQGLVAAKSRRQGD
jgi:hypothetical protein